MAVVIGLAFVLIGVGLLVVGIGMVRRGGRDRQETASWIPAQGVVVGLDEGYVSTVNRDATVKLRYPIVRYVDNEGRQQEGRAQTAASWQRHREGEPVSLRYDPRDPRRIVVGGAPVGNGPLGSCAAIVFTVFGAFWIFIGVVTLVIATR